MRENKRNEGIDFIKGIAILLVLWGHSIQYFMVNDLEFYNDWMFKIIYSFHMPMWSIYRQLKENRQILS